MQLDVTNTDERAGDEVVQFSVGDEVNSVTRRMKELRGFERISLKPGGTRNVTFTLGPADLRFYNREMKRAVEPGKFTVLGGPNSVELQSVSFEVNP